MLWRGGIFHSLRTSVHFEAGVGLGVKADGSSIRLSNGTGARAGDGLILVGMRLAAWAWSLLLSQPTSTSANVTNRPWLAMLLGFLIPALLMTGTAGAQSLLPSEQSKPAGGRPQSTRVGFFELLESGGEALLDHFRSANAESTVERPEFNSLDSPRDTVMTFIEAMNHVAQGRREPIDRALAALPDSIEDKQDVAWDLLRVIDRLPEISPSTLPGKETVRQRNIARFELFPRGIDGEWLYQALDDAPKGQIVLVRDGNQWRFSETTANEASKLLDSIRSIPPRPRIEHKGQLFWSVVSPTVTKTSPIDWLQALAWWTGGILFAWLIYRSVSILSRRREQSGDDLITPLLTGVMIPAMILVVVLGLAIGSAKIALHPTLSELRWGMFKAALVLAGIYLLVTLLELSCLGLRRTFFSNDDPYARMMSLVVRRGLRVLATIIIALFVLQNVFEWNITALIGGFGIIALALSLAAQDAVKNLFGALTIFANRPFIDGDWVRFQDQLGVVEDVSLQVTRIRLLNGEVLSIPNMKFIDSTVENLSMRTFFRRVMDVQITYDTPAEKVDQAIDILKNILNSEPIVADGQADLSAHPPRVWFDKLGSHYLNLRADYWYMMDSQLRRPQRDTQRGWFSYLDHATKVNRMVLEEFNRAGIDFAFPTQSVYLTDDPDRRLTVETHLHERSAERRTSDKVAQSS
jgi:MscS family membrane protein